MASPHRIHLGGAWEPLPAARGAATPAGWRRRFGRPTGLDEADGLWLVIERPAAWGVVLNGLPLPPCAAGAEYRHDVRDRLAARNELLLMAEAAAMPMTSMPVDGGSAHGRLPLPAACGRVWLEIAPRPT